MKTILFLIPVLLAGPAFSQDPGDQFDKLVQETYRPDGPGVAVQVVRDGKVLYRKAFGMANLELGVPMSPDNVFRIGSVTKQFTAAAILQLMEQGKLSLQDDLTKFIPDYPTHGKKITVEHLLTHTSGIASYTEMKQWTPEVQRKDFTPTELIDFFKNEPMDFEPGTKWNYSNSGYILLGYIIEKVSGQSYADYISEHIFKPLGMLHSCYGNVEPLIKGRASGYSQNGSGYENAPYLSMTQPYAAGSLASTVEDLCIWTQALHSGKVIKPESLKKAITPCILPDGTNTHYGFGLQTGNLLGSPTVEHSGGIHGFLSDLIYLPKENACVAILTNCNCLAPQDLGAKLAALAIGKSLTPPSIQVDAATLAQYAGVYENEKQEQRIISIDNGQLYSLRPGGARYKLIPYAPGQFYFEGSFARISFENDNKKGSPAVTRAIVSDRTANDLLWNKTDKPLPAARTELALPETELEKFVGEYELAPGFVIAVTREGTHLYCQATGQSRFEVFAETPTRFFLKVVDATIEFYPDDKGAVPRMVLFQSGREVEGKRIK